MTARPPGTVPGSRALARKLGIGEGSTLVLLDAPDGLLTDHVVRDAALPRGLADNKVCAIDRTWTGRRRVWRRERR